jgi:hypothetical protein
MSEAEVQEATSAVPKERRIGILPHVHFTPRRSCPRWSPEVAELTAHANYEADFHVHSPEKSTPTPVERSE